MYSLLRMLAAGELTGSDTAGDAAQSGTNCDSELTSIPTSSREENTIMQASEANRYLDIQ